MRKWVHSRVGLQQQRLWEIGHITFVSGVQLARTPEIVVRINNSIAADSHSVGYSGILKARFQGHVLPPFLIPSGTK